MRAAVNKEDTSAESYRTPMQITHLRQYPFASYYICPRCGITIEREFMAYCDRCGQCLSWKKYKKAVLVK